MLNCYVLILYCSRRKCFYLTTHSTPFILRLYGVGHMVKDHSDSERWNPLPPHGLLFPINSKGSFICTIPDRIAHTTAFVTPVVYCSRCLVFCKPSFVTCFAWCFFAHPNAFCILPHDIATWGRCWLKHFLWSPLLPQSKVFPLQQASRNDKCFPILTYCTFFSSLNYFPICAFSRICFCDM